MLLDEATSSLDPANERAVQHQDLVGGHIVQRGTHEELITQDGRYADFWAERSRSRGWRLSKAPVAN